MWSSAAAKDIRYAGVIETDIYQVGFSRSDDHLRVTTRPAGMWGHGSASEEVDAKPRPVYGRSARACAAKGPGGLLET